jgi:hypothetical protein
MPAYFMPLEILFTAVPSPTVLLLVESPSEEGKFQGLLLGSASHNNPHSTGQTQCGDSASCYAVHSNYICKSAGNGYKEDL